MKTEIVHTVDVSLSIHVASEQTAEELRHLFVLWYGPAVIECKVTRLEIPMVTA
jgi:hypothetical protein